MTANPVIGRRENVSTAAADDAAPALHPVLERIYRLRNASSALECDRSLARLIPPAGLKDIDRAVELLVDALHAQRRILIVADFDADGATGCALLVRALRLLGGRHVDYLVPNRFEYGYGLTPEIVALAAEREPELLVTVDNGISSIDGVQAAKARGMRVLITDHHLPGPALPAADAIVNPNQPGCDFPAKHLAGVGVAFYVMLALRARLRTDGWFVQRNIVDPNLAQLLDLVALGTVADLVPLDYNNRVLTAHGLARIRRGQACAGVRALLAVAGRAHARVTAADLGFCVAPRLNAAGRLQDMTRGIECLLADDAAAAGDMAAELDALNRDRRAIEATMQQQALAAVAIMRLEAAPLPRGLCLFDESWHQGVIGLVAARIKERFHRPVIAFAPGNGDEIKGSARSVSGLHIRDTLDTVAAHHPGLLRKFGGHAMAAGLTLKRESYERFRLAFDEEVCRRLPADNHAGVLSDGELSDEDMTVVLAELLREAGPWGQGFPEPVFDGCFDVVDRRVVGERHLKLTLRQGARRVFDAIAFNAVENGTPPSWARVHAAYRLDVNEYRGSRSLQLIIEHLESLDG